MSNNYWQNSSNNNNNRLSHFQNSEYCILRMGKSQQEKNDPWWRRKSINAKFGDYIDCIAYLFSRQPTVGKDSPSLHHAGSGFLSSEAANWARFVLATEVSFHGSLMISKDNYIYMF